MQGLWGIATIDHPAPVKTAAGVEANVGIDRCKKTGQHGVWPGEWKHGGIQHAANAWSKSLVPRDADRPKMKAPPLGERSLTKGRLGGGCGGPLSVNRTQKSNCWSAQAQRKTPSAWTGRSHLCCVSYGPGYSSRVLGGSQSEQQAQCLVGKKCDPGRIENDTASQANEQKPFAHNIRHGA
jgi:hypothetical protein